MISICLIALIFIIALCIAFFLPKKEAITYYQVSFNSDGGTSISNQKVKKGDIVNIPDNPSKEGYIFVRWEYQNEEFDFNNPINNNIELYAIWMKEERKYKVTFILEEQIKEYEVNDINEINVNELEFEKKEGYIIKWYLNDIEYLFDTELTSNITLEGTYKKIEGYIVTFNTNGGSNIPKQEVIKEQKVIIPKNPTKENCIFKEWQLDGKAFDFNTIITNDITLNAVWEQKEEKPKQEDKVDNSPIFKDGTINNEYFNITLNDATKGEDNTNGINDAIIYAHNNGITDVKLEKGTYYVTALKTSIESPKSGKKVAIQIPSNINFDLNQSVIKLTANNFERYAIFEIVGTSKRNLVSNVQIKNGTIQGDLFEHRCINSNALLMTANKCTGDSVSSHEFAQGIRIVNASNITIKNIDLNSITGDGITINTGTSYINIDNNNIHLTRRGGVVLLSGSHIDITNNKVHDIIGLAQNGGVGIVLEKDKVAELYSDVKIDNNILYFLGGKNSITLHGRALNIQITNNKIPLKMYTRAKTRRKPDLTPEEVNGNLALLDFPTNQNEKYLRDTYNIAVSGNKVVDQSPYTPEYKFFDVNIDNSYDEIINDTKVNSLGYKAYCTLPTDLVVKLGSKVKNSYNMSIGDSESIVIKYTTATSTCTPSYQILNYKVVDIENSNVVSLDDSHTVVTAKNAGKANVIVTFTDYGVDPYNIDEFDKVITRVLEINVTG